MARAVSRRSESPGWGDFLLVTFVNPGTWLWVAACWMAVAHRSLAAAALSLMFWPFKVMLPGGRVFYTLPFMRRLDHR